MAGVGVDCAVCSQCNKRRLGLLLLDLTSFVKGNIHISFPLLNIRSRKIVISIVVYLSIYYLLLVTMFRLGFSTVSPCFSLYISLCSVSCFVYYILIITIIIIMFVYLIDDITRNLQSISATQGGTRLYTEGLSSAKLLPHYDAQRLITAPA